MYKPKPRLIDKHKILLDIVGKKWYYYYESFSLKISTLIIFKQGQNLSYIFSLIPQELLIDDWSNSIVFLGFSNQKRSFPELRKFSNKDLLYEMVKCYNGGRDMWMAVATIDSNHFDIFPVNMKQVNGYFHDGIMEYILGE